MKMRVLGGTVGLLSLGLLLAGCGSSVEGISCKADSLVQVKSRVALQLDCGGLTVGGSKILVDKPEWILEFARTGVKKTFICLVDQIGIISCKPSP